MSKCAVKLIIDEREITVKEFNSYVEANKFKLFKEQTDHRENIEYKIV